MLSFVREYFSPQRRACPEDSLKVSEAGFQSPLQAQGRFPAYGVSKSQSMVTRLLLANGMGAATRRLLGREVTRVELWEGHDSARPSPLKPHIQLAASKNSDPTILSRRPANSRVHGRLASPCG